MSWYRLCTCCVLSVLLAWLDGPFSSDKSNIVGIVERGAGLNVCGCVWCLCVCVWCLCVWVVCVCVVTVLLAGRWTERSSIPDSGRGLFARTSRPADPPPPPVPPTLLPDTHIHLLYQFVLSYRSRSRCSQ